MKLMSLFFLCLISGILHANEWNQNNDLDINNDADSESVLFQTCYWPISSDAAGVNESISTLESRARSRMQGNCASMAPYRGASSGSLSGSVSCSTRSKPTPSGGMTLYIVTCTGTCSGSALSNTNCR